MKKRIALAAIAPVATYAMFAFIQWDFNAGNWSECWRVMCALCMTASVAIPFVGE